MENTSIGKVLHYQRKLKGYTQETLAEKSNVTKRTIQRIEKDEVRPQLQTVHLLAEALEIKVDQLQLLEDPREETIQKKWLLFLHAAPLLGFVFPFSVLFPIFIWLHKKEDNILYDEHGVKVINFQITMTLLYILALIALLTVEGWGFLFFVGIVPINILVILVNVLMAITSQRCYYPLSIPFLKNRFTTAKANSTFLLLFLSALISCTTPNEQSQFERLQEYEGNYEYFGSQQIQLVASQLDTTLYAVLDDAKYPMTYIAKDEFKDVQNNRVTFNRTANEITSYRLEGQNYKLLSRTFDRMEMLPRKALFSQPSAYAYRQPESGNDGLITGTVYDVFEYPELLFEMIQETIKGSYRDVHSILIFKNEKLVLEEYFYGYDKHTPHQLRSAIKPIIGGVMGIAIDKGYISSEKELLLPFFNEIYDSIAHLEARKEQITLEDFLRYRHGMDCENNNPESLGNELHMRQHADWVKHTLELPMVAQPGTSSSYCTGCPLTLGRVIEIATNTKLETFAKEELFTPLGISNYHWDFEPTTEGASNFRTTKMTPRDLLKLAKLYKDHGNWKEQQLLSEEWVQKTFDMEQGDYGYLWEHKYFIINGTQYNSYMASGNGGQKINIWPELDMITVFTGGNYNSYQLYGKSTPPNELIPKYILKAL